MKRWSLSVYTFERNLPNGQENNNKWVNEQQRQRKKQQRNPNENNWKRRIDADGYNADVLR